MGRGTERRRRPARRAPAHGISVGAPPGEVMLSIRNAQIGACPALDIGARDFVSYWGFGDGPQHVFVQRRGERAPWLYSGLTAGWQVYSLDDGTEDPPVTEEEGLWVNLCIVGSRGLRTSG